MREFGGIINDEGFDYFEWSLPRTDLIELIPEGARRILDVGCGAGKTGQVLRERGIEEIFGIEVDPRAAHQAKAFYKEVIVGDVNGDILPFAEGFFDCILYGDVLEHLIDPWGVLQRHRQMLSDDGTIICSIPNIRYYGVLQSLIFKGRWDYTPLGILDRTHLRFFTLKTIEDMLRETGFEVKRVIKKKRCGKIMRLLNKLLLDGLIDLLVVQYRIVGVKARKGR